MSHGQGDDSADVVGESTCLNARMRGCSQRGRDLRGIHVCTAARLPCLHRRVLGRRDERRRSHDDALRIVVAA
jgi:hypothetical protein